jgi:hypothetical protein
MQIHFIANSLGQGGRKAPNVLRRKLKLQLPGDEHAVRVENVSGNNGTKTASQTLAEVNSLIDANPLVKNMIIRGSAITKYVRELHETYPDATIYLIKTNETFGEPYVAMVADRRNTTVEFVREIHEKQTQNITNFAASLGLEWTHVNSPMFDTGNRLNRAANAEDADTPLLMAVVNN